MKVGAIFSLPPQAWLILWGPCLAIQSAAIPATAATAYKVVLANHVDNPCRAIAAYDYYDYNC